MDAAEKARMFAKIQRLARFLAIRTHRSLALPSNDIEDTIQAAYLAAWTALDEYDPQRGALTTFIYHCIKKKIVRHLAEDFLLSAARRKRRIKQVPICESLLVEEADKETIYSSDIETVLSRLEPLQREVIHLLLQGYRVAEVARMLGINPSAAYQAVYTAIQKARAK